MIGYLRIPKRNGSELLKAQRRALQAAGVPDTAVFEDVASGRWDPRPGLIACNLALRPGDILVIWRLDRLGRTVTDLIQLVNSLLNRGVRLKILTGEGMALDTVEANHIVPPIFAALASFEEALTNERTRGPPFKMTPAKLQQAQTAMRRPGTKIGSLCAELGITRQTLYRHISPDGALRVGAERLLSQHN